MTFFTKKRVIIIVVGCLLLGLGIYLCSTIHFSFFKYAYIKNEKDVLKDNIYFYSLENKENVNIKEYSASLINGYYYIDPSYFADSVEIDSLPDETKLFLTYIFITGGKKDTCIEKKFFLKMLNYYFGINKIKWNLKNTSSGYDWFLHAYCFQNVSQLNQNSLKLDSLVETDDSYTLKYLVSLTDDQKIEEQIENKYMIVEFKKANVPMLNKLSIDFVINEEIEVE